MSKNIVICSDGTGNTAFKNRGTNVFKLYEAVDIHGYRAGRSIPEQTAYYDDGVGTARLLPIKVLGMAFGLGLSKNVRDLYADLSRVYKPDDKIFLFGFSRGAFTARTLAGFILCCGIPVAEKYPTDSKLRHAVGAAYKEYRQRYRTFWRQGAADRPSISHEEEFAEVAAPWGPRYSGVNIEFIGVWDTVDAVGMPFDELADIWDRFIYPFRFPDRRLSARVRRACHAVSIDDERQTFHPTMWDEQGAKPNQVEQVWFPGVHSNIGGGYPKQGMSLVTLDWMMSQAEARGLRFLDSDRESYRAHRDVHDKLYDSRAGLAVYYRWKPRDIAAICARHKAVPRIHVSTFERIAQGTYGYAPGNLPENLEVAGTPGSPGPARLDDIRDLVRTALSGVAETSLLKTSAVKTWIGIGKASYYGFLVVTAAALFFGLRDNAPRLEGLRAGEKVAALTTWAQDALSSWAVLGSVVRSTWWWLVPCLLVIYLAAALIDRTMSRCFSAFWHGLSARLRGLLT